MNILEANKVLTEKFPTTSFWITMEFWNHIPPGATQQKLEYR